MWSFNVFSSAVYTSEYGNCSIQTSFCISDLVFMMMLQSSEIGLYVVRLWLFRFASQPCRSVPFAHRGCAGPAANPALIYMSRKAYSQRTATPSTLLYCPI